MQAGSKATDGVCALKQFFKGGIDEFGTRFAEKRMPRSVQRMPLSSLLLVAQHEIESPEFKPWIPLFSTDTPQNTENEEKRRHETLTVFH